MARQRLWKFGPRREPKAGEIHAMSIEDMAVEDDAAIYLRHVGKELAGRPHKLVPESPDDPDGIAGNLFRACGVEVREKMSFDQRKLFGMIVNARFGRMVDGRVDIVDFEPWKEVSHESDA